MDALFESAYNEKHSILWYRLTPYCADHLMALDAIDSPFSKDDASFGPAELIRAIRICSRKKLHQTISGSLGEMLAIALISNRWIFPRVLARFEAYLIDHNAYPDFWDEIDIDQGGTPKMLTGYPILARVISVMKRIPSISEERAWTMPIGLLVWYDEQAGEIEGNGKRFWKPGEEAQIEEALRRAEEEAQTLQGGCHGKN